MFRNWLVRRCDRGSSPFRRHQRYWALDRGGGEGCWSYDVTSALVFARKVDAQRFINYNGWQGVAKPHRLEKARETFVP